MFLQILDHMLSVKESWCSISIHAYYWNIDFHHNDNPLTGNSDIWKTTINLYKFSGNLLASGVPNFVSYSQCLHRLYVPTVQELVALEVYFKMFINKNL